MSFVVTIDGPSAAGKSTVARAVAEALGFLYVDTGAMYRALALRLSEEGRTFDDAGAVERSVAAARLDLSGSPLHSHVWLDGRDVSDAIRTPEVSELSSRLAAMPAVRRRLVGFQRALRERGPLVAEGRDLGTVVFPDAEVKVYLDADLETRADRRARELEARGIAAPLETVREELRRRDERDSGRAHSPLRPAGDAVHIDCSDMGIAEVVEAVLEVVRRHPGLADAGLESGGGAPEPPAPPGRRKPAAD